MPIHNVTPPEAHDRIEANQGVPYLDVRSIPEFNQGHPAGAYNIPYMHLNTTTQQMEPNADFERVVKATFEVGQTIVVGCKSGGRSAMSAKLMEEWGYQDLYNVLGGFGGGEDDLGEPVPGWADANLPVSTAGEPDRVYDALLNHAS